MFYQFIEVASCEISTADAALEQDVTAGRGCRSGLWYNEET